MSKPRIPEGTRDFAPDVVRKRNYIFDIIRSVFVKYGFQPLETPAMENLSTLTGKYGDEGDALLFKILNNGDFLKKADKKAIEEGDSKGLVSSISKRGLRYDLTVPFARFVVMNQHALTFPFKRYQIQPVWRADRPQRGRYREFYQCDVDVIGSDSLLSEAELVQIYDEAFAKLDLPVTIKINNRKVLYGIAEAAGIPEQFMDMTVAIDKLDKIGMDGVEKELLGRNISEAAIVTIKAVLETKDLEGLKSHFANSETGLLGIQELEKMFSYLERSGTVNDAVFDITLARGLSYYTGCIFEVAAKGIKFGSIGGGGRYADLTGVFGLKNMSGVGVSFGADRIYDVLDVLDKFPETLADDVKAVFVTFDDKAFDYAYDCLLQLRKADIPAELYPTPSKMKKQMTYANKRGIPYVIIIGDNEIETGQLAVKNMKTGEQTAMTVDALVELLKG